MRIFIMSVSLIGFMLGAAILPLSLSKEGLTKVQFANIHQTVFDSAHAVYFFTSEHCVSCHGHDMKKKALLTETGEDVNIIDDWAGSMMANSTRDPFWRAKVQQEINLHPGNEKIIERTCINCHAPMGMYQKLLTTGDTLTFEEMLSDTLALDGVSCVSCHALENKELFEIPGGYLHYNTDSVIYGPFPNPYGVTMTQYTGLYPTYSPHISSSGLCGKCHSLITEVPGRSFGFVEQAVYQEWLNSSYSVEKIRCQDCHMPAANSPVVISSGVSGLDPRSPFAQHQLSGGNVFMLNMLKNNRESLGLPATEANFDSAIAYNTMMLRHNTLDLNLSFEDYGKDSLDFSILLINKAGHKLPSGYPSRRLFIRFYVVDGVNGDTIFQSGAIDQKGNLIHRDQSFQEHYNVINQNDQTQIYELVPGDINNKPTTILTAAVVPLKDNRLTPRGWKNGHFTKDTTSIVGAANLDPDFNHSAIGEGSGTDVVYYRIPRPGNQRLKVYVRAYYQAIPQKWVHDLDPEENSYITSFKHMYFQEPSSSFEIASDSLVQINLSKKYVSQPSAEIYPNFLTSGSSLHFNGFENRLIDIKIYNLKGQLILVRKQASYEPLLLPPLPPSTYIVQTRFENIVYNFPIIIYSRL